MKPINLWSPLGHLVHGLDTIMVLLASVTHLVVEFIVLFLYNIHYFHVNYICIYQ